MVSLASFPCGNCQIHAHGAQNHHWCCRVSRTAYILVSHLGTLLIVSCHIPSVFTHNDPRPISEWLGRFSPVSFMMLPQLPPNVKSRLMCAMLFTDLGSNGAKAAKVWWSAWPTEKTKDYRTSLRQLNVARWKNQHPIGGIRNHHLYPLRWFSLPNQITIYTENTCVLARLGVCIPLLQSSTYKQYKHIPRRYRYAKHRRCTKLLAHRNAATNIIVATRHANENE